MALSITTVLLNKIIGIYLLAIVLRLLLRISNADFYNPITQTIVRVTQPAVAPLQSFMPVIRDLDTGTLMSALLLGIGSIALFLALEGETPFVDPLRMVIWACIGICNMVVDIYFFLVLAVIILSWVAPFRRHPALDFVRQMAEPVMNPFRRILPPLGGLDLSPILLFMVINVLQIILRGWADDTNLARHLVLGI